MDVTEPDKYVGLRIDVDTFRGTRDGVSSLLATLYDYKRHASFFFSVGPDNMGRHLWRLANPKFMYKMLRSKAASLYGWDILLRGVLWPGPEIGKRCASVIRRTMAAGHEIGLHAWDHYAWQTRLHRMRESEIDDQVRRGVLSLAGILGVAPTCSAVAGWICNEEALVVKERIGMHFNSDCRGTSIFRPLVNGIPLAPQIPVTLPTYDEVIGRNGISDDNYNSFILDRIRTDRLNVLTIHAEVEGIVKNNLFRLFLEEAEQRGICIVPLGDLLPETRTIPHGRITAGSIEGRNGKFCLQAAA